MKTNIQIIESIKDRMKFEIKFTRRIDTGTLKTYCSIIRENLEHDEAIAFFDELKKFAIENGVIKK